MDLPDFPLIDAPDYPLKEPFYKPQVRNEFENGDVQARPRFTRGRKKFAVAWEKLPHEQYAVLENFFNERQGFLFWWKHPLTGRKYRCRFSGDQLDGELVELDYYKVTVNIEEA